MSPLNWAQKQTGSQCSCFKQGLCELFPRKWAVDQNCPSPDWDIFSEGFVASATQIVTGLQQRELKRTFFQELEIKVPSQLVLPVVSFSATYP